MDKSTLQPVSMDDRNLSNIFCRIGSVLTSSLNLKEVYEGVLKIIGEYFSPQYWSLFFVEQKTGRIKFEIAMGVDANKLKSFYLEPGEGIVGWVCHNGQSVIVQDVTTESRFSSRVDQILGFTTRAIICVPLLDGNNRVLGAIELINKSVPDGGHQNYSTANNETAWNSSTFTEMDMMILSAIGKFTGIGMVNALSHQKLKEQAMIDSLTRVNNRHHFVEEFYREMERPKRVGDKICLLIMDVDNLKQINDNHGHVIGDKVLFAIAQILKSCVRKSDIVARYGGDEFVILMPMADKRMGIELSTRIQQLIDQRNETSLIPGVKLGLSIGIYETEMCEASKTLDINKIIEMADRNLYQCKKNRKKGT